MAQSTMLHVRMDEDLKAQGNAALAAIGLSAADAVRLLYRRIVADQAFPLELKVPNATTRAAMAETDAIIAARSARFTDAESLFASLEGRDGDG
jgi:DNA-damage-inducible protein J